MLRDMLGRPIAVGDTVLAKSYGATYLSQFTITKVARVNVYMTMPTHTYHRDQVTGHWTADRTPKAMPRRPSEVIVINEQLAHNREAYPEFYV